MCTAPAVVLNVNLPKSTAALLPTLTLISPAPPSKLAVPLTLNVSALSASVILVPVKLALPLSIVTLVPESSVILPALVNARLSAVFVPVRIVSLSSNIETAPLLDVNVNLPKSAAPVVATVIPELPVKCAVPDTS